MRASDEVPCTKPTVRMPISEGSVPAGNTWGGRHVAGDIQGIGGGSGGVHGDVALLLADDLVDVAVEGGDGTEAFDHGQHLRAVCRGPAPLRIDGKQWHVAEDHQRRVGGERRKVLLDEVKLLRAQHTQAVGGLAWLSASACCTLARARKWTPCTSKL